MTPRPDAAFGLERTDSEHVTVILPFETKTQGKHGGLVFIQNDDGSLYSEAGIFIVESEEGPLDVKNFTVVDGEVVAANSYWSCLWDYLKFCCGWIIVGCLLTGPLWPACVVDWCGVGCYVTGHFLCLGQ
jgi:hypothetical protein